MINHAERIRQQYPFVGTYPKLSGNKGALWQCLKTLAGENFLPRGTGSAHAWWDFQDDCPATNKIIDFANFNL